MNVSKLNDVLMSLDSYIRIVKRHEIPQAMDAKSNYLSALGLSTYTEVFGGLYRGDLSENNSRENYNTFIKKFFSAGYSEVDRRLALYANFKGLYKAVRCGLVHEYFIRDTLMIIIDDPNEPKCGIIFDPDGDPKITFVVRKYYWDFIASVARYRKELRNSPELVDKFEKALESVGSKLPKSEHFEFGWLTEI